MINLAFPLRFFVLFCLVLVSASAAAQDSNSDQNAQQNDQPQGLADGSDTEQENVVPQDTSPAGQNLQGTEQVDLNVEDSNAPDSNAQDSNIPVNPNPQVGLNVQDSNLIQDTDSVDLNAIIDANVQMDSNAQIDANAVDANSADENVVVEVIVPDSNSVDENVQESLNDSNAQELQSRAQDPSANMPAESEIPVVEKTDAEKSAILKNYAKEKVAAFYDFKKLYSFSPPSEKESLKPQFRESAKLALLSQLDYFIFELELAQKQFPDAVPVSDSIVFMKEKKSLLDDNSISDENLVLVSSGLNAFWGQKRLEVSEKIIEEYVSKLSSANEKISSFVLVYSDALSALKAGGRNVAVLESGIVKLRSSSELIASSVSKISDQNSINSRDIIEKAANLSISSYDLMGYLFFGAKDLQSGQEISGPVKEKLGIYILDNSLIEDLNTSLLADGAVR